MLSKQKESGTKPAKKEVFSKQEELLKAGRVQEPSATLHRC
jgi:hypothetical protein